MVAGFSRVRGRCGPGEVGHRISFGEEGRKTGAVETRIVLVRHGRTAWNLDYRYQGRSDVPCDEQGLEQTRRAVARLAGWRPEAVFTSPLRRARCLAEGLTDALGQEGPVVDPRLTELDFGDWEGLTVQEIQERYQEAYSRWRLAPFDSSPPGGERAEEIEGRIGAFLREARLDRFARCVVVGHGYSLRVLAALLLRAGRCGCVWRMRLDNGSLSAVDLWKEIPLLAFSNDTLHLHLPEDHPPLPLPR